MERWLGYLIVAVSLLGLAMMIRHRHYFAGILLGIAYAYFTLIIGFSFFQGSRLHYSAEMAWSILTAYAAFSAFRGLTRLTKRRHLAALAPATADRSPSSDW